MFNSGPWRNEDKRRNTGEQGCQSRRGLMQLLLRIKEECMCPICIAALRSEQLPGAKLVLHIIPSMLKAIAGSCGCSTPAVLLMPGLAGKERA